jgi:hypothetical protein
MSFIGADFFFKNNPAGWWPSSSFNPSFGNILEYNFEVWWLCPVFPVG